MTISPLLLQRSLLSVFVGLFFTLISITSFAQSDPVQINGLEYQLDSPATGEATVSFQALIEDALVIPASVSNGGANYSVTRIGKEAFFGTTSNSVSIPDSVTTIEEGAFANSELTSVIIPDSVTSLGVSAFEGAANLTSLSLGSGIKIISNRAFYNNNLNTIVIPDTVEIIGDSAFYENINASSVIIGKGVTSVGLDAFLGNRSLTSLTIGSNVASIGDQAFAVTSLTSVTIPRSVSSIGFNAFGGNKLTEVIFQSSRTQALTIGESAFQNNLLTSINIPDTVTSIGLGAFFENNLLSLTIPASVTSIGETAFSENNNLVAVKFLGDYSSDFSDDMFDFNDQIGLIEFSTGSSGWDGISFRNGNSVIPATPGDFSADFVEEVISQHDDIPEIPQESLTGIIRSNGTLSSAGISVGASADGGNSSDVSFTVDDDITLTAKVYPDAGDIGKEGEIYVVLRTVVDGKKTFVALDQQGQWEAWNGSLKDLPAALYADALEEVEGVLIYSGQMILGERLLYVGYSLFTESGKPLIHTNGKPFKFVVTE